MDTQQKNCLRELTKPWQLLTKKDNHRLNLEVFVHVLFLDSLSESQDVFEVFMKAYSMKRLPEKLTKPRNR